MYFFGDGKHKSAKFTSILTLLAS